jgi:uncharacterized protein with NRDE domain
MCSVITLLRPNANWPLLLAANRDEALDRPWKPPDHHWAAQPDVVGGLDTLAGGTWLAVNEATGVVAAVLNRTGSLGPAPGKATRGLLPLRALRHASALSATLAFESTPTSRWRSFNLIIADAYGVFWLCGEGTGRVKIRRLTDGLHMVTSADPDDMSHPRIARHLPRFQAAAAPNPPDWGSWPALLGDSRGLAEASLHILPQNGFGTASSTLVGIGPQGIAFRFSAGPPDQAMQSETMREAQGSLGMA